MREDLAAVNVTRTYIIAASNIAVFTFMLFFLYPRFETGRTIPCCSRPHPRRQLIAVTNSLLKNDVTNEKAVQS